MSTLDLMTRIVVAALLGAAIGVERQWRHRMAGLRTNALVAIGSAGFVVLSVLVPDNSPTRIAAQVASGIGFLGAGVILREGLSVRGLNTAATVWCSAAVGVLAGSGFAGAAAFTAAAILGANVFLRPVARLLDRQPASAAEVEVHYRVEAICRDEEEAHVRALLLQAVAGSEVILRRLRSQNVAGEAKVAVRADLVTEGRRDRLIEQIASRLSLEPAISAVSWEMLEQTVED
jgi:putative Mg2+ transporter-C (MgtC) family protein